MLFRSPAAADETLKPQDVMKEAVRAAVHSLKSEAIGWAQDLVRIPSITGNEQAAQSYVMQLMRELGAGIDTWCPTRDELASHPAFSDDGLPLGSRPVVVGKWRFGNSSGTSIILNGHVDVVPVGDEDAWQDGPWSGVVRDERIFGRGSCDMKGGLVAGLLAVGALRKMDANPPCEIVIESVIGEETGGVGTLSAVQRGYRASAAIVLEPTRLHICPAGAGAASFRLHVPGFAAHGAMRREGVSAIDKFYVLNQAINGLEWARHAGYKHPLFAKGELIAPISIGRIHAGDWPSTVPESLIAEGRFGILPGENIQSAREEFETAIARAAQSDEWLASHPPGVEWFEGQFEPADTPAGSAIVRAIAESHHAICGSSSAIHGVPYGSDLRFFTNYAQMPAVLYGPGDVKLAHSLNEFVPIEEIVLAAEVVALTILNWK